MNPNDHGPTLTAEETIRLVQFLGEHGHRRAAYDILVAALPSMIVKVYGGLA